VGGCGAVFAKFFENLILSSIQPVAFAGFLSRGSIGPFEERGCVDGMSLTLVLTAPTLGAYDGSSRGVASGGSRRPSRSRESRVVTKKEIVKTISEEIGLTQLKTKEIVQKTFDAIVETLVEEKRIELRNFGVFEVKKRAARKARNPRTGDKVYVPEKYVVTFKPGKEMEERVRELERQAAQAAAQGRPNQAAVGNSAAGQASRTTPGGRSAPMPEPLGAPTGYAADDTSG
jgi:integration host factor subunit beta